MDSFVPHNYTLGQLKKHVGMIEHFEWDET